MVDPVAGVTATITLHRSVSVVVVRGEVDAATVPVVHTALSAELDRHPRRLVVDLTGVEFIDPTGLRLLADTTQRGERSGTAVAVSASHLAVLRPMRLTGLDQAMTVRGSVDEAVTELLARRSG
ncbi:anti-sigma B factor antagonist [Saccharothrix variisporea]|uniref:Anti-sigma factor antagonist n=2 Tax=Saccharothrix variisporea TaxID=543527 RepID=A0A495XPN1_9PSEU|nr:anti-sigma B factor antagonist [Saccharothrix variisporea]